MGTILEKINKIKETKEMLRNGLAEKGIEIAETDTFHTIVDKAINSVGGGTANTGYVMAGNSVSVAYAMVEPCYLCWEMEG